MVALVPDRRYAEGTDVPSVASRAEIERMLRRAGATAFSYAWDDDARTERLEFVLDRRHIRFSIALPTVNDPTFNRTPTGKQRTAAAARAARDDEFKRRWRVLALLVKAKLTAITEDVSTVEREFLADLVLGDGRTVAEAIEAGDAPARLQLTAGGAR